MHKGERRQYFGQCCGTVGTPALGTVYQRGEPGKQVSAGVKQN
jgi:hypothetical protein